MGNFYPRPPRGGRRYPACRRSCLIPNFYPRPPRGGRQSRSYGKYRASRFLSTPSARRATCGLIGPRGPSSHFYPRPPRGGRHSQKQTDFACNVFLSTPSARRATDELVFEALTKPYFYPRPPRGGRLGSFRSVTRIRFDFYPRPPRGGRLIQWMFAQSSVMVISIHALREEGDSLKSFFWTILTNFYPRPPRGGRHFAVPRRIGAFGISIHALREEGDKNGRRCRGGKKISIHALREEGDFIFPSGIVRLTYFYPRPPRGGRPLLSKILPKLSIFLSTPSARRATRGHRLCSGRCGFLSTPSARRATRYLLLAATNICISIHALREEGDMPRSTTPAPPTNFYPRPPRGGRRRCSGLPAQRPYFYPRPPRGGRPCHIDIPKILQVFLSTPSARRATKARAGTA